MSKLNRNRFGDTSDSYIRHSSGLRITAVALLLTFAVFTASCGFITQGQASQNSAQTLTLSGQFPGGITNQAYNSVLTVSGGNAPYHFAVMAGTLPQGVSLNPTTGSVSGTPVAEGAYVFEVQVSDAPQTHHGTQSFSITVTGQGKKGVRVTVSPANINIPSGRTQAFTAARTSPGEPLGSTVCVEIPP